MKLVIDANIIISALIATEGKTIELIYNDSIKLFAPEYLFEETKKHEGEIAIKARKN
ncbi:TPA: hypothetical protein HA369_01700 [Candidatus Woesearchaeota archaeon]|nr:hypothetical protein [Candidatus Woesearchaeota archaeon]